MNVRTMRLLDRWVGTPLCAGLTLLRRLGDLLGTPTTGENHPKSASSAGVGTVSASPVVLIIKLAEMGSTVLALPALRRLRELLPNARFHYLCLEDNREVLDLLPGVEWETIHTLRADSLAELMTDVVRVVRRLRRVRCEVAIDLEIFSRASAALAYMSGARVRVGFHRFLAEGANCGDLFSHRLSYSHHLHTAGAFLSLVEAIAAPAGDVPLLKKKIEPPAELPLFEPAAEELAAIRAKLEAHGCPRDRQPPMLILNTNAGDLMPLRRWPADRFEELARRCLDAREDLWIVLTGAACEARAVAEMATRLNRERVVCLAGQTTLRELVTLCSLARVMVTNDSGPAHFAALTTIKTIVLFGPETPVLYGPLSPRSRIVHAGLSCSPCIHAFNSRNSPCRNNVCMQAIGVDEVFALVSSVLEGR
jgi:ADP-heptose:LPS heptosyltransferase